MGILSQSLRHLDPEKDEAHACGDMQNRRPHAIHAVWLKSGGESVG